MRTMGNTSNRRQHSSKKTRNTSRNRKSKQTPEASNTERREQIRDMTTSSAPESNQSARDEPAESTANDPASRKQSPQQQIGSSMTAPFQLGGNPSRQQETRPEWHDRYVYEPFGPFQSAPHSAPQNLPRPPIESPEFSMKLFSRAPGTSLLSSLPMLTALIKTEHIRTQKSRLENGNPPRKQKAQRRACDKRSRVSSRAFPPF
jgi:hypothetical protein